jgi:cytochrome b subunit of formate dehydrogenase
LEKTDKYNKTLQKYGLPTIFAHWILVISVIGLIITGVFPFYNNNLQHYTILNFLLPTIPHSPLLHNIFGFVLIFGIVFVTFTHSRNLKSILSGEFIKNLGAFIRSFLFIIGLDKRLESGSGNKFYGYQKITFIGILFALWMVIFSGLLLFSGSYMESSISHSFAHSLIIIHYFGALLITLLFFYHIIMAIRRFDKISFKCIFLDGKIPVWYAKKYHKIWYAEIKKIKD